MVLKVLIQNRPDTETNPGGDTVQMEQTARALRESGHKVTISFDLNPDLSGFDLVHLFNLTRPFETFVQAENTRNQMKPYVLSSVYWDLEAAVPWYAYEFPRNWWRRLVPETLRRGLRRRGAAWENPRELQKQILQNALLIFPNSDAEKSHILQQFNGLSLDRMRVIKNGVTPPPKHHSSSPRSQNKTFVCAGAIGPRKNQLNLVKAFRDLPDERLLIIGQVAPGSRQYYRATIRSAATNVEFREHLPHEEMSDIMQNAKALAQPSFIETPGLSAMEAAAAGTPIVVADVAPVREYFGKLGHYCDPASPASIKDACIKSTRAGRHEGSIFAAQYGWATVLKPLTQVYHELATSIQGRA